MRRYTRLDLIRFHRFALKNPELKPIDLVKAYNEKHPEKSAKEQLANLAKATGMNELHRSVTGEDIPEGENYFKHLSDSDQIGE